MKGTWRLGLVAWTLAGASACTTNAPPGPIRTIGEVIRLPQRDAARGRPVDLRGVVTLLDPAWQLLAIQDQTGAVLVQWPPTPTGLRLGQEIALTGATSVDNHVPSIVTASVRTVGDGHLPAPLATTIDAVACGQVLYRRVEVELRPDEGGFGDGSHTARYAANTRCGTLTVIGRLFRQVLPASFVGRRLNVRGVPIASYSPSGRLDRVTVMFDSEIDVDVLDAPVTADAAAPPPGAEALPEVRSLRDVKILPRDVAGRGYPAVIEGVVTSPNPRHTGYFLQDGSVGLYVAVGPAGGKLPHPGQRVRVRGRTERGGFAPIVRQTALEVLGEAGMPAPAAIATGDVFRGWEENRWVEITGLATAALSDTGIPQLEMFVGPRRLLLWFADAGPPGQVESFVGARVAVRGVYSPLFSASGALRGFRLYSASPATVSVVEPAPAESEFRSIGSLSQFDARGVPQHRFRTAGVVTYRDSKGRLYLQDGESTLRIVGVGPADPPLDVRATVEGVLSPESDAPRLEHVRWLGTAPGTPVTPIAASAESLAAGEFNGRLVAVEGFLESRRTSGGALLLTLLAGRTRFSAALEAPDSVDRFPDLRPGALLRLTGVHAARSDYSDTDVNMATLGLRRPDDIVLVRGAPWWDLRRALLAALAASLLLVLVLAWVVSLRQNLVAQMALRTKLEEQLLHAQKIESVGRLAGGVAHDFNNYLTVMLGHTSLLLDTLRDDPEAREQLEAIRDVGERAASLTYQLLAFSRKQVLQPVPCDLDEAIARAKATLLPLIGEHIHIVIKAGRIEKVSIDPNQFLQVLMNLAVNARDAMPHGGTLTFETSQQTPGRDGAPSADWLPTSRYACLSVSDTGTGMDAETRQRIFEPFFTTKERGQGTGLGLSVVFGIVKQSNGHIEVTSAPGEGTTFRIYLPVAQVAAAVGRALDKGVA